MNNGANMRGEEVGLYVKLDLHTWYLKPRPHSQACVCFMADSAGCPSFTVHTKLLKEEQLFCAHLESEVDV